MHRDLRVFLIDILEAISLIRNFTAGISSYEEFAADLKTFHAVVHNLEIIGEAVKQIPEEKRILVPGIEWRKIAGLRDLCIHQYFGIDKEIIWDVVTTKLDSLRDAVETIARDDGSGSVTGA